MKQLPRLAGLCLMVSYGFPQRLESVPKVGEPRALKEINPNLRPPPHPSHASPVPKGANSKTGTQKGVGEAGMAQRMAEWGQPPTTSSRPEAKVLG